MLHTWLRLLHTTLLRIPLRNFSLQNCSLIDNSYGGQRRNRCVVYPPSSHLPEALGAAMLTHVRIRDSEPRHPERPAAHPGQEAARRGARAPHPVLHPATRRPSQVPRVPALCPRWPDIRPSRFVSLPSHSCFALSHCCSPSLWVLTMRVRSLRKQTHPRPAYDLALRSREPYQRLPCCRRCRHRLLC